MINPKTQRRNDAKEQRVFTVPLLLCAFAFILSLTMTSCSTYSYVLEPDITYIPQEQHISSLPSAFPELTSDEYAEDWGKELYIGQVLGSELDLYRSTTSFKRAQILLTDDADSLRDLQIDYGLFLGYYLGGRYQEALNVFENSDLPMVLVEFPAIQELLIALFDSYMKTEQYAKAFRTLELVDMYEDDLGTRLRVGDSIILGDLCTAQNLGYSLRWGSELVYELSRDYNCQKLSIGTAQALNAILPGAGYLYVGQKRAALTSLVLNTLFTAAAYSFFHKGYWAAGAITASLELGWYFGGINGAGLAAKTYNECRYNTLGKETMIRGQFFPVLLFQTAF